MLDPLLASRIPEGCGVIDDGDDDPILLKPDGTEVDTWREGYPYDTRLDRAVYETRSGSCRSNW